MMFTMKIILSNEDGDTMKTCFMFGHADTPEIRQELCRAMEYCYDALDVRCFVVGSRGNFDCRQAPAGLRHMKQLHDDVQAKKLIAYHPALGRSEAEFEPPFDCTYYPEGLETTPNAYAIRKANEIMVTQADVIICYVCHPGNTRNLLEYARKRNMTCINLAKDTI